MFRIPRLVVQLLCVDLLMKYSFVIYSFSLTRLEETAIREVMEETGVEAGNREVKFDVYGKRQTAKIKLLPSVFSSLYSRNKISVFAVNSKRHFSIKRIEKQRKYLPFVVCRKRQA